MRSFISNFDYSALVRGAATAAVVITTAWVVTPAHRASDNVLPISDEIANEFVLEQYTYEYRQKPIVIVGSSITTMIPAPDCRPANVATIPLQGRSAITGLEAIRRVGARPDIVFIEVPTLAVAVDEALIETVFVPVYWRIRALIPPLRHTRNWIILFYQKKEWKRVAFHYVIQFPPESVAEWNREHADRFSAVISGNGHGSRINMTIATIEDSVHELQQQGTRVIFFDPIDPRAKDISPDKEVRETLRAAFPDIPIVDTPDNEVPIYRHDGLHMDQSSGLQFFNYLMNYAGVSFTPKCRLVGQPVAE
jgi:hypothetical protein